MMSNRFPGLARHWQILRTAWREQNARDAAGKARSDHEFLPAALEIMEKPPSPGLRWLLLSLCALFTFGVIWSIIGKVDVVAIATGRVVPSGNVKIVQAFEAGTVRAIHVRNGQRVTAGQILVELDPTIAGADADQAAAGLGNAQLIAARNAAIIAHVEGRPAQVVLPAGVSADMASTQGRLVRAAIAQYEAQAATLRRQHAERAAELAAANAEVAKLTETLPLIEQQLAARAELAKRGYYSKLRLLEYEQLRIEHLRNIDIQRANADGARAAMATLDEQARALRATLALGANTELASAQGEASERQQDVTRAARRAAYQQLRAPVSGTVQQLAISTIGGVVQPAQALLVIVPDDAEVVVEAQILNRDIGFIQEGQPVRVKLDAYPFADYGIVQGVVTDISRDAIDTGQSRPSPRDGQGAAPAGSTAGAGQGLVYAARIRLNQRTIRVRGRNQIIGPGLVAQAEIKTGERRIIQYILSPIVQTLDEAGRER